MPSYPAHNTRVYTIDYKNNVCTTLRVCRLVHPRISRNCVLCQHIDAFNIVNILHVWVFVEELAREFVNLSREDIHVEIKLMCVFQHEPKRFCKAMHDISRIFRLL